MDRGCWRWRCWPLRLSWHLTPAKAKPANGEKAIFRISLVKTQDGKTVRFYDDLIKDKIVIISFIYTSCTDICPLTTARLSQLEERLGDLVGRDIFFISMTVDPKRDTPERLKQFSAAFTTGPGWTFVTGDPEDIRAINYKFGERSEILSEHRNQIVLGNDATGEWQRDSAFSDLNRLVMTVHSLDPKWRDQVRPPAADLGNNTGLAMSTQPGQALFKKICAPVSYDRCRRSRWA